MSVSCNIDKFNKRTALKVNLHIKKSFYVRIWIAKKLISVAAFVLGCGLVIKSEEDK